MSDLYDSSVPGVIVRGMSFPRTCNGCRFLQAETFEAPLIGFHTTYSCAAIVNQLEAGVPDTLRTSGRLEACPLEDLPEEIHTDCKLDFGPVWIRADEELPSDDRYVICCCRNKEGKGNVVKGYYSRPAGRWACGMNTNVTHWMELPVPPEEVKMDE